MAYAISGTPLDIVYSPPSSPESHLQDGYPDHSPSSSPYPESLSGNSSRSPSPIALYPLRPVFDWSRSRPDVLESVPDSLWYRPLSPPAKRHWFPLIPFKKEPAETPVNNASQAESPAVDGERDQRTVKPAKKKKAKKCNWTKRKKRKQ
ncbi:hypothetical protein HYPSUDRAFT_78061 [Hypholoma sublateritium FD-334 SS-4]|uniref:Uncharacterized protein n=1 Tax=Hypholoma sublateritium (strain FD-334 SS-4) TaxID=945553 RepID=A0A0D2PM66_HYPSF|nr:hypothetical protein HYPSUDRAFT_78061 [Hypholoma sublateritium FD-334 SS-4]